MLSYFQKFHLWCHSEFCANLGTKGKDDNDKRIYETWQFFLGSLSEKLKLIHRKAENYLKGFLQDSESAAFKQQFDLKTWS